LFHTQIEVTLCFADCFSSQPTVFFFHTKSAPATSQPAVIFSHNKPAPATSCNNSLNVLFDVAVVVEIIDFGEDLPELHAGSCTHFVPLL